jgi:hypothetical protein
MRSLRNPERINQLAQRRTERVRKTGHRRRRDTALISKPHVRVPRRRRKDEGLRKSDEDLAEEHDAIIATAARPRAPIPHPVADEEQHSGGHDRGLGTPVQHLDGNGEDDDETEHEADAEPVDGRLGDIVVLDGAGLDGCESKPLEFHALKISCADKKACAMSAVPSILLRIE